MKIAAIREIFQSTAMEDLPERFKEFAGDERAGVQKLIGQYFRKHDLWLKELFRLEKMKVYEQKYEEVPYICGIDEAGRGPLAGPVVAGAVILPKDCNILYINDSKKLSENKREELYEVIKEQAVSWSVGVVAPQDIDNINILQATYKAMRIAIEGLHPAPGILLNDAVKIPEVDIQQVPIIKGDAKSISIAAASIMAKVTRDRMMREYDKLFPVYGFSSNKGYGSKLHIEALREHGPCPIHRTSFIKGLLNGE